MFFNQSFDKPKNITVKAAKKLIIHGNKQGYQWGSLIMFIAIQFDWVKSKQWDEAASFRNV